MVDHRSTPKSITAIGMGPTLSPAPCPEFYSTKKTQIKFNSGIYFYGDDQQKEKTESFVIGNSGLKIVINAIKGSTATAKLVQSAD